MEIPKTILRKNADRNSTLRYWIRIARDSKVNEQTSNNQTELTIKRSLHGNESNAKSIVDDDLVRIRKASSSHAKESFGA
ncbi:MAG: hypothetical protein H7235_00220 [Bdellovibrionaceae bacterium]|nr:hypothetical protein [Pseudobdellovibrionaceae bacterium]